MMNLLNYRFRFRLRFKTYLKTIDLKRHERRKELKTNVDLNPCSSFRTLGILSIFRVHDRTDGFSFMNERIKEH